MGVVQSYYQADEPTDQTPGTIWYRDDGTMAQRDLSLAWVEKGNWLLTDNGMLSKEGGDVSGPVTGSHGHAPIDNPAFTGNITLDGEDVPDKPWVQAQMDALEETIQRFIAEALAGTDTTISIGNNMAVGVGTVVHGGAITLPKYADDTRADISEVWGAPFVSPAALARGNGSEATGMAYECTVDPATLIVTCRTRITSGGGGANWAADGTANYLIICKR
jgi:hypothetical protein